MRGAEVPQEDAHSGDLHGDVEGEGFEGRLLLFGGAALESEAALSEDPAPGEGLVGGHLPCIDGPDRGDVQGSMEEAGGEDGGVDGPDYAPGGDADGDDVGAGVGYDEVLFAVFEYLIGEPHLLGAGAVGEDCRVETAP